MKRKRKHYKYNEFRELTFQGQLLEQQILYGTPDPQGRKPVGFIDGAKSTRPLKFME
jgi:hypothetical protein